MSEQSQALLIEKITSACWIQRGAAEGRPPFGAPPVPTPFESMLAAQAREGVAEMVVWPPFGKCDPLQGAQVQCQGGHAVLNLFGDGLPHQILADGARTMLFTWGKVRIGHSAPAC